MKDVRAFAQRHVKIKQNELDLIFHTRKSLPYCKDKKTISCFFLSTPWIKKEGNGEFDVTMGSNDGAETCELVGLFLLYSIGEKLKKDNIVLYRDDGLACLKNDNGHQNDKIRKELIKIFQTHGLKLEITCKYKKR